MYTVLLIRYREFLTSRERAFCMLLLEIFRYYIVESLSIRSFLVLWSLYTYAGTERILTYTYILYNVQFSRWGKAIWLVPKSEPGYFTVYMCI